MPLIETQQFLTSIEGLLVLSVLALAYGAVLGLAVAPGAGQKPLLRRLYERWRVGRTRLGTLLRRRHVDIPTYIHYTPSAALKAQLAACTHCPQTERCGRTLNSLGAATSRYAFCVNLKEVEPFFESAPLVRR